MPRVDLDLGPVSLAIDTNIESRPFRRYFSASQYVARRAEPDRHLLAIRGDPDLSGTDGTNALAPRGYRATQLRRGYYTTHYFGPPAMAVIGERNLLVVGHEVELLVWRLFVKLFLTVDGERKGRLHLKAAAVRCGEYVYLIAGTGGSGKTTFLHAMMGEGAEFLANTHVLVDEHLVADGIHSNIRFREPPSARRSGIAPPPVDALTSGELMYDPAALYGPDQLLARARVDAVLFLRRGADDGVRAHRLAPPDALVALRNWSVGFTFYELKHDVLDLMAGDYAAFSGFARSVEDRLAHLCDSVPVTMVGVNVLRPGAAREAYDLLRRGAYT